jgi:hypothetical protein
MDNEIMSYAGLTALAGRSGTSPAKASSPRLVFHYSLFIEKDEPNFQLTTDQNQTGI